MVTLKNPTDTIVSVQYLGREYSLEAGAVGEFSDEVADFWRGVHEFLIVTEETSRVAEEAPEVVLAPTAFVEDVESSPEPVEPPEDVEIESVDVAPAPKRGRGGKK